MKKLLIIISFVMINLIAHAQNPFGLVYEDALTANVKGSVNIHPVTYHIRDIKIVANVYTPPNYDASRKYATIVIAHPRRYFCTGGDHRQRKRRNQVAACSS